MTPAGLTIEQQADAILAAHGGVASTNAVSAMRRAMQAWIEAGARTDLTASTRNARALLMQAMDRVAAGRGIG